MAAGCLVILMLSVPFVSAAADATAIPKSTDPRYADRPEAIASLKSHIAFISDTQDVRMDGVIRYIDTISSGTGTTTLKQIRDDFLVTASSIPLMNTNDGISRARESLRVQTLRFSEETRARMVQFNGSNNGLRASTRTAANASDTAISAGLKDPRWLANESARLTVFNKDSLERTRLLRELGRQGINTTIPRNLSEQIDAQRPGLQGALTNKSAAALESANAAIRTLTREFREDVAGLRAAREIGMKRDAMMATD